VLRRRLADAEAFRVAELGGGQIRRLGAEDCEIGVRVRANDLEPELSSVDERCAPAAVAAGDDVGRGEHEPVGCDHDCAAAAVQPAAAAAAVRHPQVRHRRCEPVGDADHGARVGVERLRVGELGRRGAVPLGAEKRVDEGQPGHGAKLATGPWVP